MPLFIGPLATAVGVVILSFATFLRLQRGSAIPLLDLSSPDSRAADAWRAGAELGVLRLRGHSIDIGAALAASEQFFGLRSEAKHQLNVSHGRPGFHRGYIPLGDEAGVAAYLELKEGFSYGYDWPAGEPPANGLTGPNVWPPDAAMGGRAWRDTMVTLHSNCSQLAEVRYVYVVRECVRVGISGCPARGVTTSSVSGIQ